MRRTVVLDVVGLTGGLLGAHTPHLSALAKRGAMRERGITDDAIRTIVWDNPIAFFAQSGKLDAAELGGAAEVDQRRLHEGNSVLRGQVPVIEGERAS